MNVILATTPSDSHMWNLVYLEALLSEHGADVLNLGCCTPRELIINACHQAAPDLVIISSVNGHGAQEGHELIKHVRRIGDFPVVIGGKLAISEDIESAWRPKLMDAGFQHVFTGPDAVNEFLGYFNIIRYQAVPDGNAPAGLNALTSQLSKTIQ